MSLVIFSLTDAHLDDRSALTRSLQALKEQGFDGALFRLQSDSHQLLDEPVIATFKFAVNVARSHGLEAWLHLDVRQAVSSFFAQHPTKRQRRVVWDGKQFHQQVLDAPDYAALETNQFLKQLLARYRSEISDLNGVWCASPGYAADETSFFISDDFYREFADRIATGWLSRPAYGLRDKWEGLVRDAPDAVRVRCDYFSAWADMAFRVQSTLRTEAERLWGRSVKVATIPACQETAAQQVRRGTADYFRFAQDAATGGFVTAEADDEADAAFHIALARSLAKYHPTHKAGYVATRPQKKHTDVFVHNAVEWIAFSDDALPAYWLREVNATLHQTPHTLPKANVAVIYNWRNLAALTPPQGEAYRRSLMQLSQELLRSQVAFDIVPPEVMTTAVDMTDTGGFQCAEETYDAVMYPYPFVHVKADWETLKFFIENKGRIILYGLAPQHLTDGTNITAEWERLPHTDRWRHVPDDIGQSAPQEVADWLGTPG